MNRELQVFIDKYINSLLKMDLLSFFHRNPYAVGRAEDIAACLGVDAYELATDLEELVEIGIIHKKEGETAASYAFKPDRTATEKIADLMCQYLAPASRRGHKTLFQAYPPTEECPRQGLERGQAVREKKADYRTPEEGAGGVGQALPLIDASLLKEELELLGEVATWLTGEKRVAVVFFDSNEPPFCVTRGVRRSTALAIAENGYFPAAGPSSLFLLDKREHPWMENIPDREIESTVLVTLEEEGTVFGLLMIVNPRPEVLQDTGLQILARLGRQAVRHLKNSLMLRHYRELAIHDELTGLYNFRFFQRRLQEEILRAGRESSALSLLVADLDHFKRINDTLGHLEGNRSLQKVAAILKKELRQTDVPCRVGGEEFAVLLPGVDYGAALLTAERVRRAVASEMCQARRGGKLRITVSIGVSSYPGQATTPEELLRLADKAMYRAKESGRNRCCGLI